jgi:hypothetical protein
MGEAPGGLNCEFGIARGRAKLLFQILEGGRSAPSIQRFSSFSLISSSSFRLAHNAQAS